MNKYHPCLAQVLYAELTGEFLDCPCVLNEKLGCVKEEESENGNSEE